LLFGFLTDYWQEQLMHCISNTKYYPEKPKEAWSRT